MVNEYETCRKPIRSDSALEAWILLLSWRLFHRLIYVLIVFFVHPPYPQHLVHPPYPQHLASTVVPDQLLARLLV